MPELKLPPITVIGFQFSNLCSPFLVRIKFYGTFQNCGGGGCSTAHAQKPLLLHPNPNSSTQFTNYLYHKSLSIPILSFELRFDLQSGLPSFNVSEHNCVFPPRSVIYLASLIVLALIALIISVNSEKDKQW